MSNDSSSSSSTETEKEQPPYDETFKAAAAKRCEDDPLNLLQGISFMFVNYAKNQPTEQGIDFSPRKKSKRTRLARPYPHRHLGTHLALDSQQVRTAPLHISPGVAEVQTSYRKERECAGSSP